MSKPDCKAFNAHLKSLLSQRKQMTEQINQWRNRCVSEIDEYMVKVKKDLEQEYERQKELVEDEREKFMREVTTQEKKKDKEHIHQLVEQSKELIFQMSALEYVKREINFIHVKTTNKTKQNRNELTTNETEQNQSQETPNIDHNNTIVNSKVQNGNSASKPSSASDKQASRRSSVTESSTQLYPSVNGDIITPADTQTRNEATEKCPICFMIFPQSMNKQDRDRHANEHYGDDD